MIASDRLETPPTSLGGALKKKCVWHLCTNHYGVDDHLPPYIPRSRAGMLGYRIINECNLVAAGGLSTWLASMSKGVLEAGMDYDNP